MTWTGKKTTFITPYGLCNAPATFEHMMNSLIHGLRWYTCLCYMDDVSSFCLCVTHLEHFSNISALFRWAGLQLSSSKCPFGCKQITMLGHLVDVGEFSLALVKCVPSKTSRHQAQRKTFAALQNRALFSPIYQGLCEDSKSPYSAPQECFSSWGSDQAAAFASLIPLLTSTMWCTFMLAPPRKFIRMPAGMV